VLKKYDAFLNESIIKYQEDNLEFENVDYANIVAEYRDGLLLFDLMENTIWNTAKTDSTAIAEFYESNKTNYFKPKRIDATVASSAKQKTLKKVSKLLNKNMALDEIKSLVNSNNKVDVIFTSGIMDATHQALPKDFDFKKGLSKILKHNDAYIVVNVKEVLPKAQKTLEESKGAVISDYQNLKEENWLSGLREKYPIKINKNVLDKIKAELKN
jgi:peptidyl-prolyl cis-trans isomerase SurA